MEQVRKCPGELSFLTLKSCSFRIVTKIDLTSKLLDPPMEAKNIQEMTFLFKVKMQHLFRNDYEMNLYNTK